MTVNWSLGLAPDVGGMFQQGYERGQAQKRLEGERAAMAEYARNPTPDGLNALADYNPQFVMQQKQQQAGAQEDHVKRGMQMIGEAAQWADTPEKWDQAIDHLAQLSPEIAQYKGRFSPELRMAAISAAGQYGEFAKQSAPVNMAPGNRLVDPRTGKLIAEAPFAPRSVTLSEGQTAVEYNPSGDPWAGVAVNVARQFGLDPVQVGAVMSYETAGTFSPTIMGGKNGNYMGLIQFGPEERQRYGINQNSTPEQWTQAITGFLTDRGFKPGMGIEDLYSTINAGSPGRYNASDGNGTVRGHVGKILSQHVPKAQQWLSGGQGRVIGQGAPRRENAPSGYRWTASGQLEPIPGGPASAGGGSGGAPNRKAEADLRKEFNQRPLVKDFTDMRQSMGKILAVREKTNAGQEITPQDDIKLVFSYMKMLDPGSVVREGEYATAQNAASVPDQVRNAYNRAMEGNKLNSTQRRNMINSAAEAYKPIRDQYNELVTEFHGYARDYGVDPNRIAPFYRPTQGAPTVSNW